MYRFEIVEALYNSIDKGFVTLSSGKTSNYYLDLTNFLLNAKHMQNISDMLFKEVFQGDITALGGPAIGAVPLIATLLNSWNRNIHGFFLRMDQKGSRIEGTLQREDKVILVDDVVTTGKSLLRVAHLVKETGAEVKHIYSVVDREEGAAETFAEKGYLYTPLFKISEILREGEKNGD